MLDKNTPIDNTRVDNTRVEKPKPIDTTYENASTELATLNDMLGDISVNSFKKAVIKLHERLMIAEEQLKYMPIKLPMESESQNNLMKALANVIIDCKVPARNGSTAQKKEVPDLDDLRTASKEALKTHKVAISFEECDNEKGEWILLTKVIHSESGEYKTYTDKVTVLKNQQGPAFEKAGSYTFAKKKKLSALLNLGGD